jgi:hypothetical protein
MSLVPRKENRCSRERGQHGGGGHHRHNGKQERQGVCLWGLAPKELNLLMVASFLSHSLASLGFSRRMMNNAKRT